MHPLLQNRYVKFSLFAIAGLFVLIVIASGILSVLSSSTGLSQDMAYAPSAPLYGQGGGMGMTVSNDGYSAEMAYDRKVSPSYLEPSPEPGYVPNLEQYETARYSVSARTKQFDELCDALSTLKSNPKIHFKNLNESLNNCYATFYVNKDTAASVLGTFTAFSGVEINHGVESVTRHREQLQDQAGILKQQLASVERTLADAETQFNEIADFARQNKDAVTLSQAIREKLSNIDTLTQRKINLTSQLNNIYQQSADLAERIHVVQFDVSVTRSYPIYLNQDSQKWEVAWKNLKDNYTDTLIGLTAFFGIFLLWTLRITIYLVVLIIVVRVIWKFVNKLWKL